MNNKHRGRDGSMAIKLDMSKAYDRVEWDFLEAMMIKLGFATKWVHLIMTCVTSVNCSILVNGQPKGNIIPTRGLRQGDPLSPYLFLLCAEGLSAMLKNAEERGHIKGVQVCRGSPSISHLFFADDSLLFAQASTESCNNLKAILKMYELSSGQMVNACKSAIFFSKNITANGRQEIQNLLGIRKLMQNDCYLGLPLFLGGSRRRSFDHLRERVWKRVNGWKEKLLSMAGREVLIKAVAQSIPIYSMSCFLLPKGLSNDLNAISSRFWWGQQGEERRIHWKKWGDLCKPKSNGGMGFRDLQAFNLAMLSKQGWRLVQKTNSLAYSILKAKYFKNTDFMNASCPINASKTWKSICAARGVIEKGAIWRVAKGKSIRIWGDSWIPSLPNQKISSECPPGHNNIRVSTLMDEESGSWNKDLIKAVFREEEIEAIAKIPMFRSKMEDKIIWGASSKGIFSVRSAYYVAREIEEDVIDGTDYNVVLQQRNPIWKIIWSLKVQPKIRVFAWRWAHEILPTIDNLNQRGMHIHNQCFFCRAKAENWSHVFLKCDWSRRAWTAMGLECNLHELTYFQPYDWLQQVEVIGGEGLLTKVVVLLWAIWGARNKIRVDGGTQDFRQTVVLAAEVQHSFPDARSARVRNGGLIVNEVRWLLPPHGLVKINTDIAIIWEENIASFGVAIRDNNGEILLVANGKLPTVGRSQLVEALGILHGMRIAISSGYKRVAVESDALEVIQELKTMHPSLTHYGHVIDEIQMEAENFEVVQFFHTKRTGNMLAHHLAKDGLSRQNTCIWLSNFPSFVAKWASYDISP